MAGKLGWPLRYKYGQRIAIVGPAGSGKTRVLKALCRMKRNVVVIDTKLAENWDSVGVDASTLIGKRAGRYVWHADEEFVTEAGVQSRLYRNLLHSGPRVVAIDEGYDALPSRGLKVLATQGRGKRVSLIVGMQRPTQLPLFLITEANYYVVFALRLPDDRKRIEAALGLHVNWDKLREQKFSFYLFDDQGRQAGPYRLRLDKR